MRRDAESCSRQELLMTAAAAVIGSGAAARPARASSQARGGAKPLPQAASVKALVFDSFRRRDRAAAAGGVVVNRAIV